jgi:hypothetical protein
VYAVKSSARAELLNHIMDASAHIRNNQPSLLKSVTSISFRATMCINNHGDHFEHFIIISIK